jgi:hypothetical protein
MYKIFLLFLFSRCRRPTVLYMSQTHPAGGKKKDEKNQKKTKLGWQVAVSTVSKSSPALVHHLRTAVSLSPTAENWLNSRPRRCVCRFEGGKKELDVYMSTAAFCCVATNADHARTSESTRIDITTSQKYGREKHTHTHTSTQLSARQKFRATGENNNNNNKNTRKLL